MSPFGLHGGVPTSDYDDDDDDFVTHNDDDNNDDIVMDDSTINLEVDEEEVTFLQSSQVESRSFLAKPAAHGLSQRPRRLPPERGCGWNFIVIGWIVSLALAFYGGYQYHAYLTKVKTCSTTTAATRTPEMITATTTTDGADNDVFATKSDGTATTKTLPQVSFVFLSGTEGSGHHLYSTLYKASPSFRWLFPEAVHVPENEAEEDLYQSEISQAVRETIRGLFQSPGMTTVKKALFSAPCAMHKYGQRPNGKKLFAKLVQNLRTVQQLVEAKLKEEPMERIAIPLNSVSKLQPKGSGMMSYPNFNGECRSILFPNLDLLYQACEEAQVSCQHIVLFRNAYEVIRSTTRTRRYDSTSRQMTYMHPILNMMATNVQDYGTSTAGCWDYNAETPPWQVGRTLGWQNQTAFENTYRNIFQRKKTPILSEEDRDRIVPERAQIFMTSMLRATERLRQTCWQAVKENRQ